MVPRLEKPLDKPGGNEARCTGDAHFALGRVCHSLTAGATDI